MKKLITLILAVAGYVGTASADGTTYKIYIQAANTSHYVHVWGDDVTSGKTDWPGNQISSLSTETVNNETYYVKEVTTTGKYSFKFDEGQDLSESWNYDDAKYDVYIKYDGGTTYSPAYFVETISVSFVNEYGWTQVCAYPFKNNSKVDKDWPGTQLTETESGSGIYTYTSDIKSYTVASSPAADHIIFNNGTEGNENSSTNKTPDLIYENGKTYQKASYTVNFVNNKSISNVYAYTFNPVTLGEWSNTETGKMSKINGLSINSYDVYTLTYTSYESANIIFHEGDTKTGDLVFENGKTYFEDATAISVTVKLSSTGMSTFCSPYALDLSGTITNLEGAYIISSLSASYATLSPVTAVPANTGIILKGTASAEVTIPVGSATSLEGTNKLVGTTAAKTFANNEAYILYDGEFHPVNAGTIPVFKAYLDASDVPASARALSLVFEDATGIAKVEGVTQGDSQFYNISGQRVSQPSKGLYIVNGKKVVIK